MSSPDVSPGASPATDGPDPATGGPGPTAAETPVPRGGADLEPGGAAAASETGGGIAEPAAAATPEPRGETATEPSGAAAASDPAVKPRDRRTLALAATTAVSLVVAATFAILWATDDAERQLETLRADLATDTAAEDAASRYALSVSQVQPGDIEGWRRSLQTEVSEQLAPKLSAAVDVVGPWLTQMEYTSTAKVLAAQVSKREGDLYTVQVFVDMNSRSRQTPEGVAATAAYTVTLDRAANWTITDVGGVTPELPGAAPR